MIFSRLVKDHLKTFLWLFHSLRNSTYLNWHKRRPRPSQVIILITALVLLTSQVTPNFQNTKPFRLSRIEQRMATYNEPMDVAFDALLTEYLRWHSAVTRNRDSWRIIRVLAWNGQGSAGMGDKMRGLLHAFMLAMETQRYFLLEDVPDFPVRRLMRPGAVRWDTGMPLDNEPLFDWRTSFALGKQGVQRLSLPRFEKLHEKHRVVRLASSTYPHYERTVSTAHWRATCRRLRNPASREPRCGYLSESNIRYNRAIYAALFRPRRAVLAHVKAATPRVDHFVGVHARIGGSFRAEARTERFRSLNVDWEGTSERLLRCASALGRPVYLATDDERFKEVFKDHAERRGAYIVASPIKPRHTGIVAKRDIVKALTNTLVEAMVLGKSDTLVTTGSGLATFAAFSGSAELVLLDECDK